MKDIKENVWIPKIVDLAREYGADITGHEGIQKFFADFGGNETPSASKHHGNYDWGHWEHNYMVIKTALEINKNFNLQFSPLSIIKVILVHDIKKFLFPCVGKFNKNGERSAIPWEWTDMPEDLPEGAVALIYGPKYFPLDSIELQAVFYHNGEYDYVIHPPKDGINRFSWFIHNCDMFSSHNLETTKVWKKE